MIEWLEGGVERPAQELIEDYTRLGAATLEAALR